MKRTVALLTALAALASNPSLAADKLYFENNSFIDQRDDLTNGTQVIRPGFFGTYDFEPLVSENPEAFQLAQAHSRQGTYAGVSMLLGIGFIAGGAVAASTTDQPLWMLGGVAGYTASVLAMLHFIAKGRHYLHKSVNTYNGVYAPKPASSRIELDFAPAPGGGGGYALAKLRF